MLRDFPSARVLPANAAEGDDRHCESIVHNGVTAREDDTGLSGPLYRTFRQKSAITASGNFLSCP